MDIRTACVSVGRSALGALVCALVAGCLYSRVGLRYDPGPPHPVKTDNAVEVAVTDLRPFVKSGEKDPAYLGHYRGTPGRLGDARTRGNAPLAAVLRGDLTKALKTLGFATVRENKDRVLKVGIVEFSFDAFKGGTVRYEVKVTVLNKRQKVLKECTIKDARDVKGNLWTWASGTFSRQVRPIYQELVSKIVRDNPDVLEALR